MISCSRPFPNVRRPKLFARFLGFVAQYSTLLRVAEVERQARSGTGGQTLRTSGATSVPKEIGPPSVGRRELTLPQAATPSFFCKLVEDVVYWKVSRLSG